MATVAPSAAEPEGGRTLLGKVWLVLRLTGEGFIADDAWSRAYSRAEGCFPAGTSRTDKYWSPVGRVDNVYGDRNLVCSCPPVADYAQAAE